MCRRSIYLGWFALVMGFVATSVVEGSDPSLVGWWKLNEISGTTAADSSGYGNNGTLVGNPKWVTGKIGGSLELDGSGDYVSCGDNAVLQIRDQITMACWIKAPAIASSWATIISKGNDSYRMSRPQAGSVAHIGFDGTSSAPYTWFDGTRTIANNQWHHVAGVYDGSQARIYVDGVLDTAQAATGQLNASTSPLYIGDNSQSPGRYWNGLIDDVRLYNRALTQEEIQVIMLGKSEGFASMPNPENGDPNVPRDCVLGWEPGEYADKHNVYFGTDFNDVNNASMLSHPNVTFANVDVNHFDPGTLGFNTTYHWRVDEVNAPPNSDFFYIGDVWSFTVEPFAYQLPELGGRITPLTTIPHAPNMGPEKTIDGSGLNNNDQHSTAATSMWLSSSSGPQPTWIQYEFDKVYKLHQMWVWNSNQSMEPYYGYGMKNVTIEYSPDGNDWKQLDGVFVFAQATGKADYTHNTTVDFGGVAAKFVKITAISNWKGLFRQYGLSEVRFFYIPASAWLPWPPASGEIGVSLDAVLSWRAGRNAAVHEVYFSNDMNAVEAGTALVGTVNKTSLPLTPLGLELGKTYYWKVNEVNDSDFPAVWEGDLWSFTTTQYLTVEDFEQYNNSCNRIYYSWTDGLPYDANKACGVPAYNGNGTSSMVGNPFAERGTVHEGGQSMPLAYYNYNAPYYSETSRQWPVAQDWTRGGAKRLSLWFYGGLGNSAQPLYVVLEDSVGTTKVVSYDNPESILSANWQEWTIPLTSFAGVNLSSVKKMYIGVGNRSTPRIDGTGTLYIDDIRLYP